MKSKKIAATESQVPGGNSGSSSERANTALLEEAKTSHQVNKSFAEHDEADKPVSHLAHQMSASTADTTSALRAPEQSEPKIVESAPDNAPVSKDDDKRADAMTHVETISEQEEDGAVAEEQAQIADVVIETEQIKLDVKTETFSFEAQAFEEHKKELECFAANDDASPKSTELVFAFAGCDEVPMEGSI